MAEQALEEAAKANSHHVANTNPPTAIDIDGDSELEEVEILESDDDRYFEPPAKRIGYGSDDSEDENSNDDE
jgi:hypothetical protein